MNKKKTKAKRTYRKKKLWLARDCNRYRVYRSVNPPVIELIDRLYFCSIYTNGGWLYGFCARDFSRLFPQFKLKPGEYRQLIGTDHSLVRGRTITP